VVLLALIDMEGAVDLHIHSSPCIFPRLLDDEGAALLAADAGFSAIVIKSHHESTVSRARALDEKCGSLRVFGGVCLNYYVGGINPNAVEAALRLGGKIVWMPTVDSRAHEVAHGGRGVYDAQSSGHVDDRPGITILDKRGDLVPEVLDVLTLIAQHDAVLGTSHLSYEESLPLVKKARELGVRKILITHPFFKVPSLSVPQLQTLTALGATAEFAYCTVSSMWAYATIKDVVAAIKTLGPERCAIMSDCGQMHNPPPHEALRVFAQCLHERGLSPEEIDTIAKRNPRRILGLE
jgi:hypothetical protein